jgi:hypothetical protein
MERFHEPFNALLFGRELVRLVEDEVEQRGMRSEQQIGRDRRVDFVGCEARKAGLRVFADIGKPRSTAGTPIPACR